MFGHDDISPDCDLLIVPKLLQGIDRPLPWPIFVEQRPATEAEEREEMGMSRLVDRPATPTVGGWHSRSPRVRADRLILAHSALARLTEPMALEKHSLNRGTRPFLTLSHDLNEISPQKKHLLNRLHLAARPRQPAPLMHPIRFHR